MRNHTEGFENAFVLLPCYLVAKCVGELRLRGEVGVPGAAVVVLVHFKLQRMPVVTFGFSAAARDESGKGFVAGAGQASNSIEIQITKLYNVEGFYICIQCLNRLGHS